MQEYIRSITEYTLYVKHNMHHIYFNKTLKNYFYS